MRDLETDNLARGAQEAEKYVEDRGPRASGPQDPGPGASGPQASGPGASGLQDQLFLPTSAPGMAEQLQAVLVMVQVVELQLHVWKTCTV